MIIETRYRDIPLEQVRRCAPDFNAEEWARLRGQPVTVGKFCECHPRDRSWDCGQPKFHRADGQRWLCSCFAEIGD